MARIAILDYGAGNIFSLKNALERLGASVSVEEDPARLAGYDGIFLPGVGSFDTAMGRLGTGGIPGEAPVFGICLGMEMFFERSAEGSSPGLGVMAGSVEALPDTLKVPHMGWNSLEGTSGPYFEGVPDGSWAYFVHSFMAVPDGGSGVVASSDYGVRIPAAVQRGRYFGTQFHPEKSGPAGARILENFLGACSR